MGKRTNFRLGHFQYCEITRGLVGRDSFGRLVHLASLGCTTCVAADLSLRGAPRLEQSCPPETVSEKECQNPMNYENVMIFSVTVHDTYIYIVHTVHMSAMIVHIYIYMYIYIYRDIMSISFPYAPWCWYMYHDLPTKLDISMGNVGKYFSTM